ncbi:hypothetical protein [Mesorhizobium sp. WSM4906]|uniref:hypothetical protein n=1 Tax=Mesorhizobium sp. WSM4906 TaxID=3038546 RepID=UPI00241606EA|nr:hypothetical protein [Mesorhizobium sp. WSM4906]WFP75474.1 hypothetical protein QAZ22_27795 [Mesorhizobium sp. WSM4906]
MGSIAWRNLTSLQVLALALASCSSSDTIEQQSKLAASTAEAAVLVTDSWLSGAAPSHYASAALQSFAGTLGDAGRQVQSASSSDTGRRDAVKAAVGRLSIAATGVERAVKAEQQAQASQARQDLRAAQADLVTAYRQYLASQQ